MSTQPRGLYQKFRVRRTDGRDLPGGDRAGAAYIVLDVTFDEHSRTAALAYADAIAGGYPDAADDLRALVARMMKPAEDTVQKAEKTRITFIVNGEDVVVNATRAKRLGAARNSALEQSRNTGRRPDAWEIRNAAGSLVDAESTIDDLGIDDGDRLFLTLKMGWGG